MRILITRPIEDAKPLADALAERGIAVLIEPLLEIRQLDDAEIDLDDVKVLLFTSANGVRAFAALSPRRDVRVFTVGDGSAEAARQAGFTQVESAKGDVESLAALVVDRVKPSDGVLFHAAGTVTAGDLKARLEELGYRVRRAQLYEAKIATALSTETRANLTLGGVDAVMLFSPRTARTFAELWQAAGAPTLGRVFALCLSAAVAREIANLGWRAVETAERPDLPSMLTLVDAARTEGADMAEGPSQRPDGAADAAPSGTTASGAAQTARRSRTGGSSMLFYLTLILVSAAAAVASAPLWQPKLNALLGIDTPAATPVADNRVDALQAEVEALSARVQGAVDAEALRAAIGAAIDPINADLEAAKQEVAALKSEIETLRAATPSSGTLSEAPGVNLAPLEERLGALETRLDETSQRLATIAAMPAPSSDGTATETPTTTPVAAPDARVDMLVAENEKLKQQIASLTQRLDQMSDLDAKLQELTPRLDALGDQVASLPKGSEQQRAVALIVAIGELRSALASDKSFAAELATLGDLSQGDETLRPRLKPIIDGLSPFAEAGVPTLSQLAAGFPTTEIARAGEADLAGEVTDDNWLKRLWRGIGHSISEVITVRPTGPDVEGDDTLARLARAEAKLSEGDLQAAVAEVRGMTGLAAETASEWLAQADARLAIEQQAAQLADISTRELAPLTTGAAPVEDETSGAGN